ncbi:hypothetical protein HETIRDRAFT_101267 [Heterobasidion irregulare TC 32-1]|uniref:Uncharacterized protein n=1 Tax=Heterobasidion irregulare (strain TC 32-1) TaxID=747525 RepID=W4K8V1_HETIT|nr:uncharacterized protein HETIRDRAFT_101267 [Heterobasidion irregulare TC 32-1]ETW82267.1 hypothetical protein HETIRDRAFT_101267 [Heterobasidion irregulare TC 32-1]
MAGPSAPTHPDINNIATKADSYWDDKYDDDGEGDDDNPRSFCEAAASRHYKLLWMGSTDSPLPKSAVPNSATDTRLSQPIDACAMLSYTVLGYALPHYAVYTTPAPSHHHAPIDRHASSASRAAFTSEHHAPCLAIFTPKHRVQHSHPTRYARAGWGRPGGISLFCLVMPFTKRLPPNRVNA